MYVVTIARGAGLVSLCRHRSTIYYLAHEGIQYETLCTTPVLDQAEAADPSPKWKT